MLKGDDILSTRPDVIPTYFLKGFITKNRSEEELSYDVVGRSTIFNGKQLSEIPKSKPRNKFYLIYNIIEYKGDRWLEFRRFILSLPSEEIIYINDCHKGVGQCYRKETRKTEELFREYSSRMCRTQAKIKCSCKR